MSFKVNEYQQLNLIDSYVNTTSCVRKMIENSWAKDFSDIVFPAINEKRFSVLYSSNDASRPNTPINVIIGALMLKELNGLTDDELIGSICCDIRYQYALHTTSYKEQPVSDRTFSRFRERLYNYELENGVDLLSDEMKSLSNKYADFMKLRKGVKRIDSLMVATHSRTLSRIQIIYRVVANALKLMHRLGCDDQIPSDLLHYLDPEEENLVIYHSKGEDAGSRLEKTMEDAVMVRDLMSDDNWHEFQEYQLLIRVLREQTTFDKDAEKPILKENSEVSPQSLQNASDPVFSGYEMDGKGERVVRCPAGHEPLGTTYYEKSGICRARFAKEHCSNCPFREKCRAIEQKKNYAVMVSAKKVSRAKYLEKLSTEDYKKL